MTRLVVSTGGDAPATRAEFIKVRLTSDVCQNGVQVVYLFCR